MPALFDVLAEPTRRRILDEVRERERSVGELVERLGISQPRVSKHLAVLRAAGLVDVRQDAQRRLYRVRPGSLAELDAWLEPYRRFLVERPDPPAATLVERPEPPDGTLEEAEGQYALRFERDLPYPVERVWDAITRPGQIALWWLPFDAEIELELEPGGRYVMRWTEPDPGTMSWTVLRVEPLRLFVHTHEEPESVVRWALQAHADGCRMILTQTGKSGPQAVERHYLSGLHMSLERLELALEGRPSPWLWSRFEQHRARYVAKA
jgi:DNA-binding transcriptional ArsR family regulator/uncharacterized protein YndB with AHSA1/START domain